MTLQILSYQKLLLSLLVSSFLLGDADTTDIDLDALWESTVWEEIEEINEIEGEVEQVTSVAGVRGAEAEDEALEHLYYRKSMKGLSKMELQKALGKLLKKRSITKNPTALKKINGYTFDWIPKEDVHINEGHDVGVVAQEVEEVLPEVCTTRDNGYKAVKYEKLTPLLIECIKKQQEQLDKQQEQIENLQEQINMLSNK